MKQRYLLGLGGLLLLGLIWQWGATWLAVQTPIANQLTPSRTWQSLNTLLTSGEIFPHIFASLQRIGVGLVSALLIGIPFGVLLGFSPKLEQFCTPAFQFLRMISPLSWMPIAVMLLGVGDLPVYFLLAFATVWSIMLATSAGVKSISPEWLMLGRSMAASRWELLYRIVVPAIIGQVLTGLRVAIGIAWVVLVPCEMLGVSEGLGYFILDTRDRLAYGELMAVILIIGVIGWTLDSAVRRFNRH